MNQFTLFFLFVIVFSSLFLLAEWCYRRFSIHAEITRKSVHVLGGLGSLLLPHFLHDFIYMFLLTLIFSLLLELARRKNRLGSIHGIQRGGLGSVSFPIGVFCCWLCWNYASAQFPISLWTGYYLPLLVLSISDPMAALGGKWFPLHRFRSGKSIGGALFFFISALSICVICFVLDDQWEVSRILVYSCCIALMATMAELFSRHGLDNVFIPISVCASVLALL